MKIFIIPIALSTAVALAIHFAAPELGPFAWGSAWVGAFFTLSIWALVKSHHK